MHRPVGQHHGKPKIGDARGIKLAFRVLDEGRRDVLGALAEADRAVTGFWYHDNLRITVVLHGEFAPDSSGLGVEFPVHRQNGQFA